MRRHLKADGTLQVRDGALEKFACVARNQRLLLDFRSGSCWSEHCLSFHDSKLRRLHHGGCGNCWSGYARATTSQKHAHINADYSSTSSQHSENGLLFSWRLARLQSRSHSSSEPQAIRMQCSGQWTTMDVAQSRHIMCFPAESGLQKAGTKVLPGNAWPSLHLLYLSFGLQASAQSEDYARRGSDGDESDPQD